MPSASFSGSRIGNGEAAMLLRRLSQFTDFAPHEVELIRAACTNVEDVAPGTHLFAEGDRLSRVTLVVSGWACQQRILSDGRRQIFGFALPGDLLGPWCRSASVAQTTAVMLKTGTIADVTAMRDLLIETPQRFPALSAALAALQSLHEGYLLNHLVRLGRQTAYERVASLLLELNHRSGAVGLVEGRSSPLPLTQELLADALGLSIVHINRTLQQLRRDGLLDLKGASLRLLDADQLTAIAEFQPPCTAPAAQDWRDFRIAAQAR